VIGTFIVGAMVGGAAMYFYGEQIRGYLDQTARSARERAAGTLQSASEGLQSAKQRMESAADTMRHGMESAADTARPGDVSRPTTMPGGIIDPGRRVG
jgi:hypothetical protein